MTLARVSTFRRWLDIAPSYFNFATSDVTTTGKLATQRLEEDILPVSPSRDRSYVARFRTPFGFFLTVAELGNGKFLVRSGQARSMQHNATLFAVIDINSEDIDEVLFAWKLTIGDEVDNVQHWGTLNGNLASCDLGINFLNFQTYLSCRSKYVMIVGPAEDHLTVLQPTVKCIYFGTKSEVKNVTFKINGSVQWPATAVFHPRPRKERIMAAVCSSQSTRVVTRDKISGTLVQYSTRRRKVINVFRQSLVCSSLLNYIRQGDQLVTSTSSNLHPQLRSMLVLDSSNLQLLYKLPILATCSIQNIFPLFSIDGCHLALIMWRKQPRTNYILQRQNSKTVHCNHDNESSRKDFNANNIGFSKDKSSQLQVAVYKVPRTLNRLKMLCFFVILKTVPRKQIRKLPLPQTLITEIRANRRF